MASEVFRRFVGGHALPLFWLAHLGFDGLRAEDEVCLVAKVAEQKVFSDYRWGRD